MAYTIMIELQVYTNHVSMRHKIKLAIL